MITAYLVAAVIVTIANLGTIRPGQRGFAVAFLIWFLWVAFGVSALLKHLGVW